MDKKLIRNVIIIFAVYSFTLLLIGRNLSFLPAFEFKKEIVEVNDLRKSVIDKFLKSEKGTYSIYYKDLSSGQVIGVDENKVLTAASLNKIVIASYLYKQAENGEIDLEDKIVIQEKDIQDYGTGSIRYGGEGKAYTLKHLTKLMLEQSDNTAAYVLDVRLGKDNIQEYADSIGLAATDIVNNKTSARDMGVIFERLYSGGVVKTPLKEELLDFLKDTEFEDRIARDMPSNVSVHHKAADAITMVHDAGIVTDGKKTFVLAILTTDVTSEEEAKKNIGKLSKFIYEKGN